MQAHAKPWRLNSAESSLMDLRELNASPAKICWHAEAPRRMTVLRLASDEDVHGGIIRGLRRRLPEIDSTDTG
jgi:hypothetical protein